MKNIEKVALLGMAAVLKQKDAVFDTFNLPFQPRSLYPPAVTRDGRPKVGRNAPCPCESGKKFKKCCLAHPYDTFYKGGK